MRQCTTKVWDRYRWGSFPCSRKGVVEWDGKFYCKQHDPVKVKARQEEQTRKWDQKQSAKEHTFACVRAVESIGGDPETVGELVRELTDLVKRAKNSGHGTIKAEAILAKTKVEL